MTLPLWNTGGVTSNFMPALDGGCESTPASSDELLPTVGGSTAGQASNVGGGHGRRDIGARVREPFVATGVAPRVTEPAVSESNVRGGDRELRSNFADTTAKVPEDFECVRPDVGVLWVVADVVVEAASPVHGHTVAAEAVQVIHSTRVRGRRRRPIVHGRGDRIRKV